MLFKQKYTQKDLEELQKSLDNSKEYQEKKLRKSLRDRKKPSKCTTHLMTSDDREAFSRRNLNSHKGLFTFDNLKVLNPTIGTIIDAFTRHTLER